MSDTTTDAPVSGATAADADRFWRHVIKSDGCWVWDRPCASGYGYFQWQGRPHGAHRAAYLMFVGSIADGLVVRHKCDNPPCVRPDHLELGTKKDNGQDVVIRGRKPKHYDYLISLRSAALALGVRPDTLRQQVHRGKLVAVMLGGWHVRMSEVERYRREHLRVTKMDYAHRADSTDAHAKRCARCRRVDLDRVTGP